jgi:hypothetical protein
MLTQEQANEQALEAIRRAAMAATNALMSSVMTGYPRHVYFSFGAVERIERFIVDEMSKENLPQ